MDKTNGAKSVAKQSAGVSFSGQVYTDRSNANEVQPLRPGVMGKENNIRIHHTRLQRLVITRKIECYFTYTKRPGKPHANSTASSDLLSTSN